MRLSGGRGTAFTLIAQKVIQDFIVFIEYEVIRDDDFLRQPDGKIVRATGK